MATVSFTMRVDADLKAAIEEEARREDLSASQVAIRAIRSHLRSQEAERAAIEAALKEAEKGEFISGEAVMAWVQSWGTDEELAMPEPDIRK